MFERQATTHRSGRADGGWARAEQRGQQRQRRRRRRRRRRRQPDDAVPSIVGRARPHLHLPSLLDAEKHTERVPWAALGVKRSCTRQRSHRAVASPLASTFVSSRSLGFSWACRGRTIQILEAFRRRRAFGRLAGGGTLAAHHSLLGRGDSARFEADFRCRRLVGANCFATLTCFSHVRQPPRLNFVLRSLGPTPSSSRPRRPTFLDSPRGGAR